MVYGKILVLTLNEQDEKVIDKIVSATAGCSLLSVPANIASLSDFALPCPFRKGLYLPRF